MIRMHHHHRRRKKRPNYANGGSNSRTVEVCRGNFGFGFTISGQQPCVLTGIVANSPADLAGLRGGGEIICVNGITVNNWPHENVVKLIQQCNGNKVWLTVNENYNTESSDDDLGMVQRFRPKYHQNHKPKVLRNERLPLTTATSRSQMPFELTNGGELNEKDLANVSAMVRTTFNQQPMGQSSPPKPLLYQPLSFNNSNCSCGQSREDLPALNSEESHFNNLQEQSCDPKLQYNVIVGYLGTIEMPKPIATSSRLQTVRSCIKKMRQEKRQPTSVLMVVDTHSLTLKNSNNQTLATYPSNRLSYVSNGSQSESDGNRVSFGLVTAALYNSDGVLLSACPANPKDVIVSNSCHVFMVDQKLIDHQTHADKIALFKLNCTRDPISNLCLEFPRDSDYVVNLIRSMYALNVNERKPPKMARTRGLPPMGNNHSFEDHNDFMMANSPQPSNHSELTTTSSNSDSGIGFHNDCTNISDRILVVDFPGLVHRQDNQIHDIAAIHQPPNIPENTRRPCGIFYEQDLEKESQPPPVLNKNLPVQNSPVQKKNHRKSKSVDYSFDGGPSSEEPSKLTVRAMPNPRIVIGAEREPHSITNSPSKMENSTQFEERAIDVPEGGFILATRSCENLMKMKDAAAKADSDVFRVPRLPLSSMPKSLKQSRDNGKSKLNLLSYKLSPKVFGLSRPSLSHENLVSGTMSKDHHGVEKRSVRNLAAEVEKCAIEESMDGEYIDIWGSIQEMNHVEEEAIYVSPDEKLNRDFFLIGAISEPNLNCLTKSLSNGLIGAGSTSGSNNNVGVDGVGVAKTKSSPFRRYGQLSSSFRSQLTANEAKKMLAANGEDPDRFYYAQQRPTSLAASEGDIRKPNKTQNLNTKSLQGPGPSKASSVDDKPVSVVEWSNSFEKILEDVYGLHAFAEFLKKEFSAENIYFWTACERYRKLDLLADRQREAKVIFERHLECGAPEPVNVDSQATSKTKEQLEAANPDLFSAAQKQIFNLMKFDSYARFIKSDVYKNCLDCELQKSPPPYPEKKSQFDVGLRTSIDQWPTPPTPIKLKKSLSNAEDRRRKSLLPWHRKTRSKSKERNDEKSLKNSNSNLVSNSDIHSSRSSLSSFDAVLSKSYDSSESSDIPRNLLCRVILADGATTIVQTRSTETIRELVDRLLEKRGIVYTCFEVFTSGNSKPCDLEGMSIQLAGKQVTIEQRVTFKMDLPNRKVISVKSKPIKMLEDVLRPILFKYNYVLENVSVFMKCDREPVISGEQQAVDLKSAVTTADGNRLQVIEKSVLEKQSRESGQNLDEITNKVFNELLQVKVDSQQNGKFDAFNNHRLSDQNSIRSGDDASLNIINRLKRIDNITSHLPIRKAPKVTSDELENGLKKPLIAKLTAGVRLQSPTTTQVDIETPPRHHHHYHNHVHQQLPQPSPTLLEGIKRAQKERLEDQRGTEINYELPEFLRNSRTSNGSIDSSEGRRFALQQQQRPKPAPRLSINKSMGQQNTSTSSASSVNNNSIDSGILSNRSQLSTGSLHSDFGQNHNFQQDDNNVDEEEFSNNNKVVFSLDRMIDGGEPTTIEEDDEDKFRAPPPLPPKPKILPIKPSNWGNSSVSDQQSTLQQNAVSKNAYLDQPTSSFV